MLSSQSPDGIREILIVEDDFAARTLLAELLESRDYSVATAADGRQALDYLRTSSPPKVIILDLMMPVMDGWEFLEHQAHDPALTNIPIVVLSATESPQPTKVNAILQKPVQVDAFVELVEQFLPH
jgi:CheY-like chemotaxis protein